MPRPTALVLVLLVVPLLIAADPTPVEKQLAVQKAMLAARQALEANRPDEAIAALEAQIANADGNKAFLTLLRESYEGELARLEKLAAPDSSRVALLRRHLALLGAPARTVTPAQPAPSMEPAAAAAIQLGSDSIAEATAEFKRGNFAAAGRLFAANARNLTADRMAAWAYCRVWAANERVNSQSCDAAAAAAIAADVAEALKLAPNNAELQKIGQRVIAAVYALPQGNNAASGSADRIETASFRVHCPGNRELGEKVGKAAESLRKAIFERWSGPPAGAWSVKCDIHIHATSQAFAAATGLTASSTGSASVRLSDGRAEERRIDLRADDATIESNALPRELTHVVLADLFPDKQAPKWAVEGMAILAVSPEESERYLRTLRRCARDGEWIPIASLLEMKDFPKDNITAFYCESVALVDYLIRALGSERNFTIFLRDCQRYGSAQALKRQLNIESPQALEAAWKRAALDARR